MKKVLTINNFKKRSMKLTNICCICMEDVQSINHFVILKIGTGHARNHSSLDMEGLALHQPSLDMGGLAIHQLRGARTHSSTSDSPMPRTCPVSPVGSRLLHPRSPQHMNGRMSPSPISSPKTTSGSSMPLTGGNGAIPFHHLQQSTFHHDGFGSTPRSPYSLYSNCSTYHDPKPDFFLAMQSGGPHAFQELIASENDILGKPFGRPAHGSDLRELYDGQPVLANRVSQQLLRDHVKLNPAIDLTNPALPMLDRSIGI